MRKPTLLLLAMLLAASVSLACGGSSKATATSKPASGGTAPTAASSAATSVATTASGAATTVATVASGAATVIATTVKSSRDNTCSKIPLADVQVLTPQTLQPSTSAGIGQCLYHNAGQDVTVTYYLNDDDMTYYNTEKGAGVHDLSGVGDEAYWVTVPPGQGPPALTAHKGSTTCEIISNDPPDTTLKYTGSEPFITVTDADALAYVQLMAKVCEDVFAAQ